MGRISLFTTGRILKNYVLLFISSSATYGNSGRKGPSLHVGRETPVWKPPLCPSSSLNTPVELRYTGREVIQGTRDHMPDTVCGVTRDDLSLAVVMDVGTRRAPPGKHNNSISLLFLCWNDSELRLSRRAFFQSSERVVVNRRKYHPGEIPPVLCTDSAGEHSCIL